ncbi:MAG TPA: CPBP family intramembrane glutamic endopeptidase [Planctomycetota bacterium]
MRWPLGLLALAALSLVFLGGAWGNLGLLAYHGVCATSLFRHRRSLRPLFAWRDGLGAWTLGTTLAFLAGLGLLLLLWDPARARGVLSFPSARAFALTAAYTMLLHASLEEIFWRGAFTDVENARPAAALLGNALTFYLVHVIALTNAVGGWGWVAALPTAAAGLAWGWVTLRTRSLWPALVSHWAADAAILAAMAYYYLPS